MDTPYRPGAGENLGVLEDAGFRHDVARALQDMLDIVEPGAMRHRGGIERRVGGIDAVHVGEIGERHGMDVAVGDHHAFRLAGGAGGVEEPGEIVAAARHGRGERIGREHAVPVLAAQIDHGAHGRRQVRRNGLAERTAGEDDGRFRILDDPGGLLRMQLGVDRHGGGTGEPDAVKGFEILRAVLGEDRDTVARPDAVITRKRGADGGGMRCEGAVVGFHPLADAKRGARRVGDCRPDQPFGQIHGSNSSRQP
jgi:hypothetical protein